ncbi:hypothetical protein BC833DRAFT_567472 [Globomyces pollinis-pini]|nr:hypothetical protein BC833DRAFT_567472 [Globomyces pollinis-pini]
MLFYSISIVLTATQARPAHSWYEDQMFSSVSPTSNTKDYQIQLIPLAHTSLPQTDYPEGRFGPACGDELQQPKLCALCPAGADHPSPVITTFNCNFNKFQTLSVDSGNEATWCDGKCVSLVNDVPTFVSSSVSTLRSGDGTGIWKITPVSRKVQGTIYSNGKIPVDLSTVYTIQDKKSGRCLTMKNSDNPMYLAPCSSTIIQLFMLLDNNGKPVVISASGGNGGGEQGTCSELVNRCANTQPHDCRPLCGGEYNTKCRATSLKPDVEKWCGPLPSTDQETCSNLVNRCANTQPHDCRPLCGGEYNTKCRDTNLKPDVEKWCGPLQSADLGKCSELVNRCANTQPHDCRPLCGGEYNTKCRTTSLKPDVEKWCGSLSKFSSSRFSQNYNIPYYANLDFTTAETNYQNYLKKVYNSKTTFHNGKRFHPIQKPAVSSRFK